MKASLLEKVTVFDKDRMIKAEIQRAMQLLKDFRAKYPFTENPESIETLDPNGVFKEQTSEVGEFFHWLEFYLKPIGHLTLYGSNVYRQIRNQLDDFKELLYVTVDPKKSLADKVDAPWERIRGLGGDRHIAKKIIFCFNHETGEVLPIFKTTHLEHFFTEVVDQPKSPGRYGSLGETYEYLTSELLIVKHALQETRSWELPYFSRFLYDNCTPPRIEELKPRRHANRGRKLDDEERKMQIQFQEFRDLLNELQRRGKISGREYRDYGKRWRGQPQDRESLVERLRQFLNK